MTATVPNATTRRKSLKDIRAGRSTFDFAHRPWRYGIVSGVLIVLSLLGLVINGGLDLGIDFTGGTVWVVEVSSGEPTSGGARDVVEGIYDGEVKAQVLDNRSANTQQIRVQAGEVTTDERQAISDALAEYAGSDREAVSISQVSASWGRQISGKALQGLLLFLGLVVLYLSFRLEWKMAASAVAAVIHDVFITVGVYAWLQFPVTPSTVIAFLTILGFSLYDTVVVFDKVQENQHTLGQIKNDTYSDMVNRSTNQVLMRSLNTSFVAVLPVVSLLVVGSLILGASALVEFSLALLVGLLVGTYSSIFVAVPMLAWLKEKEPRNRALRERAFAGRSIPANAPTPSSTTSFATANPDDPDGPPVAPAPKTSDSVIRARPRKQHRKK